MLKRLDFDLEFTLKQVLFFRKYEFACAVYKKPTYTEIMKHIYKQRDCGEKNFFDVKNSARFF